MITDHTHRATHIHHATDPFDVDFADPQTFVNTTTENLHRLWRRMQEERPAHRNEAAGGRPAFWVMTRYDDIVAAFRDNVNLTSMSGNVLTTLLQGFDSAGGKMIAVSDGPHHREIRNLMLKSFTPKAMAPVLHKVEARTSRLVDAAIDKGDTDFVGDVANHVSINTIGDLMDIPEYDRPQLVEWNTLSLGRYADDLDDLDDLDEIVARNELLMYFADLADHRRRHPGDDVVSVLANGTVNGRPLTEDEVVLNCYSLTLGADQASRMSSIGGVIALAEQPQQWSMLRDGEVDVKLATEEILRWTTPAMHTGRMVVNETVIAGQVVRPREVVTLWNAAANVDESVFEDPTHLRLDRQPNRHVTFGHGPHFCLGAFLGRAHVEAVLVALRSKVRDIELSGPPRRLVSNFVQGYTEAPMRLLA